MEPTKIVYTKFQPSAELKPHVSSYGTLRATDVALGRPGSRLGRDEPAPAVFGADHPLMTRLLPNGDLNLVFCLDSSTALPQRQGRGALAVGAVTRPLPVRFGPDTHLLTVALRPGRSRVFLDVPARELTDRLVPLSDLWGGRADSLVEELSELEKMASRVRVIDRTLRAVLARCGSTDDGRLLDGIVSHVIRHQGKTPIGALASMYGTTRQTLARRFREEIGLTPKEFSRLVRFGALLGAAARPGRDWSALATRLGYYDQAHMISEFKRLTGITPGAFFAGNGQGRRTSMPGVGFEPTRA